MTKRTWLITGCSGGLGLALAQAALQQAHSVVATARNPASLQALTAAHGNRCLALALDVTSQAQIQAAVLAAYDRFGAVDVLVNNAGQGLVASAEDAAEEEVRAMFELNFFGLVNLTRAVLPRMRERGSGHIINISSIAGLVGRIGSSYYAATKFAVEGFSEALALEARSFGLHVTLVEPAGFRTGFSGSMRRGAFGAYAGTVGARLQQIEANRGHEAGDPARAAQAIIDLAASAEPPLRLPLGKAAVDIMRRKIDMLERDLKGGEQVAIGADFPDA